MQEEASMGGWVGTNSDDIPSDYLILDKTSKLHFVTHHILDGSEINIFSPRTSLPWVCTYIHAII